MRENPHIVPAEDGLYPDILDLHYRMWEACNQSGLKEFERSPAHYREERDNPPEVSAQKQENWDFGDAIHKVVLQPGELEQWFQVRPEGNANSNDYKAKVAALKAENPFMRILKPKLWDQLNRIHDAVWANGDARALLEGAVTELSGVFTDPTYGVRGKIRLDARNVELGAIADLKSTTDARPDAFFKQVEDLRYYRQGAFYIRGAAALGLPERDFAIIAVEKEPPYGVWVHELTSKWILMGEAELEPLLARFADCERTGVWPGYPTGTTRTDPTDWQERAARLRAESFADHMEVAA